MKTILSLVMMLCVVAVSTAQYNKWAVSAEFGGHVVGDESAQVTNNYNHFGGDVRLNLSERFALGISAGYDNLDLLNFEGSPVNTDYYRANFEGTVEIFDMLHLQSNAVTLLGHGGPGVARISTSTGYDDYMFQVAGGLTALVKLSRNFALKLDYTGVVNVNHERTFDGYTDISNVGVNSTISNFSGGIVLYPNKKGNKKQHADWYDPAPIEYVQNHVVNNFYTIQEIKEASKADCNCEILEFVFFEHDKDAIKDTGLNAITKIYTYLKNNPTAKLSIVGYASATKSSDDYNIDLSNRRALNTLKKIREMGIDASRITISGEGKDQNWSNEFIHDMARRVELIIVKQ